MLMSGSIGRVELKNGRRVLITGLSRKFAINRIKIRIYLKRRPIHRRFGSRISVDFVSVR